MVLMWRNSTKNSRQVAKNSKEAKNGLNGGQLKHKYVTFLFFCFFLCADYLVCLFVRVCVTMRVLLANKQATLRAAYLGCAKLALHHGASSWTTIRRRGGMLKDAAMGYVSIQTIFLCCRLISTWHELSFTCFRQVLKGLLVFGAAERITLPLELFATTIGLVQAF